MRSTIQDLFTVNYYEQKSKDVQLYNADQVLTLTPNPQNFDLPYAKGAKFKIGKLSSIKETIIKEYPIIYDLLNMADGQISLCGGSITNLIKDEEIEDFDIFFHCNTIEQADRLLAQSMKLLNRHKAKYTITQAVETVYLIKPDITIQFIRRVYQTKEQILLGFDLAPSRMGWNPVNGFFTTICGARALVDGWFPLDLTQRSLSMSHRVNKYIRKDYSVVFPGWSTREDILGKRKTISFKDFTIRKGYKNKEPLKLVFDGTNYTGDYSINHYDKEDFTGEFWLGLLINEKYECIKIYQGDSWIKLKDITDIDLTIFQKHCLNRPYHSLKLDKSSHLKDFFKDDFKEFANCKYILEDEVKCEELWNKKLASYYSNTDKILPQAKANPWKYINPGGQDFGKLHPIKAHPSEWYGKNYYSTKVGLDFNAYPLIGIFNQDIVNHIHYVALKELAFKARERLLVFKEIMLESSRRPAARAGRRRSPPISPYNSEEDEDYTPEESSVEDEDHSYDIG